MLQTGEKNRGGKTPKAVSEPSALARSRSDPDSIASLHAITYSQKSAVAETKKPQWPRRGGPARRQSP